jgi:undecaprenyl pyrophosphate synthase
VITQALRHLAIIPDGNRRWSARNNVSLERTYFDSCTKMLEICGLLQKIDGLQEVSLFFVSSENLRSRPQRELDPLFKAGHHFLDVFYSTAQFYDIELKWIGPRDHDFEIDSTLFKGFIARIGELKRDVSGNRRANVLVGYDVRKDIEGAIRLGQSFNYEHLDVSRPVDLIIRSGGHRRLSGFLPLMCQYAEFDFVDKLFPDVTLEDVTACIERFSSGERTFGA